MVAKENVTIENIVVGGTMGEPFMRITTWNIHDGFERTRSMMSLGDDLHALHRETLFNDEFR